MADFHTYATFAIIAVMVIAYVSDRFALESVAIGSLAAFLALFALFPYSNAAGEAIGPEQLVAGFANPALVTVIALLIVGQGLFATDAMDGPARMASRAGGASPFRALAVTLLSAAFLSAFLNNTPVVVIFIPVLTVLAAQRNFAASRALMPLSFLSILGGMTTIIGSSTNLLVAGVAQRNGHQVGFFDITAPGLTLAVAGALYIFFVMPRILGRATRGSEERRRAAGAQFIGEITVGAGHPFLGMESRAGLFPGLKDLMPRLIIRRGMDFLPPFENMVISEGDRVVVSGTRRAFMNALARGSATPSAHDDRDDNPRVKPGAAYHVAETVVTPGSRHAGRTVRNAGIQSTHGVDVLGIQRKSRMGRVPLADIRLEPGDTVLVGADEQHLLSMRDSHDLLLLEWSAQAVPQRQKAWIAFVIFALIVTTAATSLVPIVASSVIGAAMMIATGCLTLQQAARAFDRQIFLLVGSSIAAATALEQTGGARLIADTAVMAMAGHGPVVLLSGLFLVIALLTNVLSNNATAVLFTPIALDMAASTGMPAAPFIAAVIFASNASFATPVGYQTNLLVMGPGGYRFSDFVKAGLPLVLLMWLTFTVFAPWYYGL
ncbi:MAG: SLC13 family permease [Phyllobacteriaceae bacterium]|nr:SLC13 family permease [Phyllobacteriaceae bacterium]MBA93134.1 SLC13 family permease [Phyllobacteriaceae bacterium]